MEAVTSEYKNKAEKNFIAKVSKTGAFRLFALKELPMAFLAGLRLNSLDPKCCKIDIPFRWINKNPFQSIYFACLAMAAEMSTGLMAMAKVQGYEPKIALLVVGLEAMFMKKATGVITFTCDDGEELDKIIEEVVSGEEARKIAMTSIGRNEAGEPVARFEVTWSFKQRSS